jgi:hypothetical protein
MKEKLLSFAFNFFCESGLFKGLQPIQMKKFFPRHTVAELSQIASLASVSGGRRPFGVVNRKIDNTGSDFPQENTQNLHRTAIVIRRCYCCPVRQAGSFGSEFGAFERACCLSRGGPPDARAGQLDRIRKG